MKLFKVAVISAALFVSTAAWAQDVLLAEYYDHYDRHERLVRECESCRHREKECWAEYKRYYSDHKKRICNEIKYSCNDTCSRIRH